MHGAEFVAYEPSTGTWRFRVPHFSRWGTAGYFNNLPRLNQPGMVDDAADEAARKRMKTGAAAAASPFAAAVAAGSSTYGTRNGGAASATRAAAPSTAAAASPPRPAAKPFPPPPVSGPFRDVPAGIAGYSATTTSAAAAGTSGVSLTAQHTSYAALAKSITEADERAADAAATAAGATLREGGGSGGAAATYFAAVPAQKASNFGEHTSTWSDSVARFNIAAAAGGVNVTVPPPQRLLTSWRAVRGVAETPPHASASATRHHGRAEQAPSIADRYSGGDSVKTRDNSDAVLQLAQVEDEGRRREAAAAALKLPAYLSVAPAVDPHLQLQPAVSQGPPSRVFNIASAAALGSGYEAASSNAAWPVGRSDACLALGRSFRVSWGPGDVIVIPRGASNAIHGVTVARVAPAPLRTPLPHPRDFLDVAIDSYATVRAEPVADGSDSTSFHISEGADDPAALKRLGGTTVPLFVAPVGGALHAMLRAYSTTAAANLAAAVDSPSRGSSAALVSATTSATTAVGTARNAAAAPSTPVSKASTTVAWTEAAAWALVVTLWGREADAKVPPGLVRVAPTLGLPQGVCKRACAVVLCVTKGAHSIWDDDSLRR